MGGRIGGSVLERTKQIFNMLPLTALIFCLTQSHYMFNLWCVYLSVMKEVIEFARVFAPPWVIQIWKEKTGP